jgi:polar amino acid transport system substrate-binding protein
MHLPSLIRWFLLISLPVALLAVAACGDDDEGNGVVSPTATEVSDGDGGGEIDISGVPELEDGTLTIGSDIAYAPIEFYEEGTDNEQGLDVDIARAIGDALGVDVEFQQVADFAGIVGDLQAERYDIVMSAISITEEREAEIDFVPYFGPAGTGILVATGNPNGIDAIEDLCGLAVAAQVGTVQVDYLNEANEAECADNQIDVKTFPDNPTAVQELALGRVDAELADDPVAAYSALQSDGELEVVAPRFDSAPYGIGVRKDSTALKDALEAALQQIMDDGTYTEILEKWGQEDFAYEGS